MTLRRPGRRPRTLFAHLCLLALAVTLPILIFSGTLAWRYADAERARLEGEALAVARRIARSLERELGTLEATAETIAAAPSARMSDLEDFHRFVTLVARQQNANVGLRNLDSRQLVNTNFAWGATLPTGTNLRAADEAALRAGDTVISDGFRGVVDGRFYFALVSPVRDDGGARGLVSLSFPVERLLGLLENTALPPGARVSIVDSKGVIVVRAPDHAANAGRSLTPFTLEMHRRRTEAAGWTRDAAGADTLVLTVPVANQGWGVALGVPGVSLAAPLRRFVLPVAVIGLGTVLLSAGIAWFFARRLSGALGRLEASAAAIARGEARVPPATAVREVDAVGAVLAASAERLRATYAGAPVGLGMLDASGRFVLVNEALGRINGASAAAHVGRAPREVIPGAEGVEPAIRRVLLTGETLEGVESRGPGPDGSPRVWTANYGPIRGKGGAIEGVSVAVLDITERQAAEERQILLAREVDHRAKNALAVVLSVLRLTRAEEPRAYVQAVEGRVTAMARAHTLLADEAWDGADLGAVLRGELAPYLSGAGEMAAVRIEGPPVRLSAGAVQPLAMAVHELATNAAKYGALSVAGGRLTVSWNVEPVTGGPETEPGGLTLTWRERGGPPVAGAPGRRGFGTSVLQATLVSQLGGALRMDWGEVGLTCVMTLPGNRLAG